MHKVEIRRTPPESAEPGDFSLKITKPTTRKSALGGTQNYAEIFVRIKK